MPCQRPASDPGAVQRLIDGGLPPLAARVLAARGIISPGELSADPARLATIDGGDSARAASEIAAAVSRKTPISVVCDFDADGVCGAALTSKVLDKLEARNKVIIIGRDRLERGLDADIARQCAQDGAGVIVTVDNGTNSHEGIKEARRLGLRTVVTDHHQPGSRGPAPADATANPALADSGMPATSICGAMVALLVMRETVRKLGAHVRVSTHLDLAATATVADRMLMSEQFNRQTVMAGLAQIRSGGCQPGLKALLGGKRAEHCSFRDLYNILASKLNSAGRMNHPETALACLLAKDIDSARRHAREVEMLDRQSRQVIARIMREAFTRIIGAHENCLVTASRNWQPVGLGLVAEELVRTRGVPCAALAPQGATWRGSLRGPRGSFPVHDALAEIEREHPGMLEKWGGHRNAVGVTLRAPPEEFAETLDQMYGSRRKQGELPPGQNGAKSHDGEPSAAELCDGTAEKFAQIPWGEGFPEPLFAGSFEVAGRVLTASGNGYMHTLRKDGTNFPAWSARELAAEGQKLRLLYRIGPRNRSRGQKGSRSPAAPRIYPDCRLAESSR